MHSGLYHAIAVENRDVKRIYRFTSLFSTLYSRTGRNRFWYAEGGNRTLIPFRVHDFESCASANSATPAGGVEYNQRYPTGQG
jgi:hypothetical protein